MAADVTMSRCTGHHAQVGDGDGGGGGHTAPPCRWGPRNKDDLMWCYVAHARPHTFRWCLAGLLFALKLVEELLCMTTNLYCCLCANMLCMRAWVHHHQQVRGGACTCTRAQHQLLKYCRVSNLQSCARHGRGYAALRQSEHALPLTSVRVAW